MWGRRTAGPGRRLGGLEGPSWRLALAASRRGGGEDPWLCGPGFRRVCLFRSGLVPGDIKKGGDLPRHLPSAMTPGFDTMSSVALPLGGKYPRYCQPEAKRPLLVRCLKSRSGSSTPSPGPSSWPMRLGDRSTRRLRSASAWTTPPFRSASSSSVHSIRR
jgi:hypothetical protein